MSKKTWKDHLLSSGVPLEHSVLNLLEELKFTYPSEYKYVRQTPAGLNSTFSVDVKATKYLGKRLIFEIFVECKYRHEGSVWVFSPIDSQVALSPVHHPVFPMIDYYNPKDTINRYRISDFSRNYPHCRKAIEILPNDKNPKTIEQAVEQLRYALITETSSQIVEQINDLKIILGTPEYDLDFVYVNVPIIVTTARLARLNQYVTVKDIQQSHSLEQISEDVDLLFYHDPPDNLARKHMKSMFMEDLQRNYSFDEDISDPRLNKSKIESKIDSFSFMHPSFFVITKLERFQQFASELIQLFNDEEVFRIDDNDDIYL